MAQRTTLGTLSASRLTSFFLKIHSEIWKMTIKYKGVNVRFGFPGELKREEEKMPWIYEMASPKLSALKKSKQSRLR
jgi:hypothetical protein